MYALPHPFVIPLYDASMIWTNRATVYDAKNPVPHQHQRRRESRGTKATTLAFPLNINNKMTRRSCLRCRSLLWIARSKPGNDAPSRRQDQSRRESRGTKATTLALPLNINNKMTRRSCLRCRSLLWIARNKPGDDAPSRRHSRHPSRPRRRRDDWGVGNPEEQRQPPWHSR